MWLLIPGQQDLNDRAEQLRREAAEQRLVRQAQNVPRIRLGLRRRVGRLLVRVGSHLAEAPA